ncbi:MAG: tRNA pseudouridine(38-40) synthase TruA [Clostridiales bacterium]|nr:tRNA pseudouridine(38-40) synthase TruA [Clostridiales bacterium]
MRNFKVIMAYDGSRYHGFQRQSNSLAVQQVVEDALKKLLKEKVTIFGCSRTDTGVHAREFVFNFFSESTITPRGIVYGANDLLPDDISFFSCVEVDELFNARYNCIGKEYEYIIHNSEIKNPFYYKKACKHWFEIDAELLNEQSKDFIGTYDFKSFCSTDCDKDITVRTIHDFSVSREGDIVKFKVSGDGFLYNMVRIMIGTLLYINDGKIDRDSIKEIIKKMDRRKAGKTVVPDGLYLNKVFY